jgi:hypothetical protein
MDLQIWWNGDLIADSSFARKSHGAPEGARDLDLVIESTDNRINIGGLSKNDIILDILTNATALSKKILRVFFIQEEPLLSVEYQDENVNLVSFNVACNTKYFYSGKLDDLVKYLEGFASTLCRSSEIFEQFRTLAKEDLRNPGRSAFLNKH